MSEASLADVRGVACRCQRRRLQMSGGERGFLDPRTPWADACDVSGFNNPSTCSHSDDSGGAAALVPPRTPRSSVYDVYAHAVYVVICYMSLTCICLLYVCHPRDRQIDVSGFNNPSTCSHSDDSGGAAALVPPRTPRRGVVRVRLYVIYCAFV
jgi:hypothetical protein